MTLAPLGDSALVVSWSEELDDAVLGRVSALADTIVRAAIPGVVDVVPAFATVTVHFVLHEVGPVPRLDADHDPLGGAFDEGLVSQPGADEGLEIRCVRTSCRP